MKRRSRGESVGSIERARQVLMESPGDATALYERWYHEATGRFVEWPLPGVYRAATLDATRFRPGWRIDAVVSGGAGAVVARSGDRTRVVAPLSFVPEDPRCLWIAQGVAVAVDPIADGESNGFWHAWSNEWQVEPPTRFCRLYLNVQRTAAPLLARIVATLTPDNCAWAMKALCRTHDAGRRDRVVVYLPGEEEPQGAWFDAIIERAAQLCEPGLPPFVAPITPGIGWAPDPGGGISFGEAVCAAVASAQTFAADAVAFRKQVRAAVAGVPGMRARRKRRITT